jgi:hypothetical protein
VFHDFAAEEGLVEEDIADVSAGDEPVSAGEKAVSDALKGAPEPEEAPPPEVPAPSLDASEEAPAAGQEDTQVHDMSKELGLDDEGEAGSGPSASQDQPSDVADSLDSIELDDLDLELDSDEIDLDGGEIEVSDAAAGAGVNGAPASPEDSAEVEEVEEVEQPGVSEPETGDGEDDAEAGDDEPADGEEDVLEETPEFLRDAPESDRLWFEQGKPKDFDFDEDE